MCSRPNWLQLLQDSTDRDVRVRVWQGCGDPRSGCVGQGTVRTQELRLGNQGWGKGLLGVPGAVQGEGSRVKEKGHGEEWAVPYPLAQEAEGQV